MLMSDKMEVLLLLLMFFTVSGYSYILQPRLSVMQIDGTYTDHRSEMRSEQLRDVSLSPEDRINEDRNIATAEEWMNERVSSETNPVRKPVKNEKTLEGGEKRGADKLSPETKPAKKNKIQEKNEDEIHNSRNIGETLEGNQGHEKISEERLTPEIFSESILGVVTKREEHSVAHAVEDVETGVAWERRDDGQNSKTQTNEESRTVKTIAEEERESQLVAGISLYKETSEDNDEDEKTQTVKLEIVEEKGESEETDAGAEKEDIKNATNDESVERVNIAVSTLKPPLSTVSASEISSTIQIITVSQNSHISSHQHNVHPHVSVKPTQVPPVSSLPPTHHGEVTPQIYPSAGIIASPTVVDSVSLIEDHLVKVLQTRGRHNKHNELVLKVSPNLEDVIAKNPMLKPAQKEPQTTHKAHEIDTVIQANENKFVPKVQESTPKPQDAKLIAQDFKSKEPDPKPKSNEHKLSAKLDELTHKPNTTQPTGKHKTSQLMKTGKLTKPQRTSKTQNKRSKNKKIKSKQKKSRKDDETQKPSEKKKKAITPIHFPYFKDNYCPPECACYGRVVQCSDKGMDKVPYGIPYNARYILLMNNHINSIQLDLLSQYASMEFLVLSNNQLTNGAIEGAFEGVQALKRLYLDRNLLESVPTDLPDSLEEIRLDNNRLSVMSEAAWAQCPDLLVLSLSNNSLGNGSESLPNAVLAPLCRLRTLNLNYNQLTSVPLGLPLSVKELYLKGNVIEQFRGGVFSGISELVVLDLSANRLRDKGLFRDSLINATHLESINFEGNRLKQVPRHVPLSLKTLNLDGNLITSIKKAAFLALKNLEHLSLARNKIFKVAPGAFRTLPVLHQLDLSHNTLHQVPKQLPRGLHSVALTHNKIHSVPRDAFCWGNESLSLSGLVRVQLEHNLIDMGKLDVHAFRCLRGFQVVHFY